MKYRRVVSAAFVLLTLSFLLGTLPARCAGAESNQSSAVWTESFELPSQDSQEAAWWRESMKTRDQRLAWWREARFGMFIHWGVYSGLGNEFQGRKGGGYAEHIQRVLKIPIPVYRKEVAGNFNPTNFDADTWVRLAKDAGMGYIVITAKHHDGFAMWPTKVNAYNIMDATPWHHDPMADLKAACDNYGVKFGFYYSQAFDWGNENAAGNDWEYDNPGGDKHLGGVDWWKTRPEFMFKARKYVDEKAIPQLQELIRLYHPAILWFDTSGKLPASENLRIMKAVRAADPNVVISGRLVRGWGDYDDTTDRPAEFPPHAGDWEGIPTTDESYGWNKFDTSHKPPSHFIRLLAKASARGGNLLMNVGPMGTGEIDPKDVAILKGIADWWKVNGESIHGTSATPLPVQTWGESAVHTWGANAGGSTTIYLHVFDWPTNGTLVVGGLKSTNLGIAYLQAEDYAAHSGGSLSPRAITRLNPLDVSISVPLKAPDKADSVIILNCSGKVMADAVRLLQPEFSSDTLRAFDAELQGKGLKFGPGKKTDDYVTGWASTNQYVAWPVRVNQPTKYDVFVNYDAASDSEGNTFRVSFNSPEGMGGATEQKSVTGVVKAGTLQTSALGQAWINGPGNSEIKITGIQINGGELMRLRSIVLKPVP